MIRILHNFVQLCYPTLDSSLLILHDILLIHLIDRGTRPLDLRQVTHSLFVILAHVFSPFALVLGCCLLSVRQGDVVDLGNVLSAGSVQRERLLTDSSPGVSAVDRPEIHIVKRLTPCL